ncbi:hypothetical protein [Streptomyces beijiangensis]|uniref:Uncharacterized protein n=1 Tax=Streptomyces beijiangensis TaxID=163361 RepID=A0A939JDK9_9ACTN|nr:hypothetical protein [Streptomyces beijiangensis]MBO0512131.1 hypothetical protein [Streptomyces beijiangensis]
MFGIRVGLSVLLLLEVVPSAVVAVTRARVGLERLDQLTRTGVLEGRRLWLVSLLGVVHTLATVGIVAGLWVPAAGVAGAGAEVVVFGWVLSRQLAAGDRGRALGAYTLFLAMAVAVLAVDAVALGTR